MDRHGAVCALADVQEAACDDVTGRAAIQEEEVVVVEAGVGEALGVVDLLVQADDGRHVVLPEVREIRLGCVQRVTCGGAEHPRVLPSYMTLCPGVYDNNNNAVLLTA